MVCLSIDPSILQPYSPLMTNTTTIHIFISYTFLSFEVRIRQKICSYMNLAKCIEPMCWLGGMRYAIYMLLIGVEGVYA